MGTLIPEIAALGLAVALTSPGSVVTVIALLTMSNGVRRAIAFICGWILAIGVLAVLMIFVLHGQDFGSRNTTPSRTASAIEVVLGSLLVIVSLRGLRRPSQQTKSQSPPKWLDRIDRTNWALGIVVGAFMLTFTLTVAAMAEILKANVGAVDAAVACLVFALTSIVTIAAPVVVVLLAPDRSAQVLATWKAWLLGHARSIALILLMLSAFSCSSEASTTWPREDDTDDPVLRSSTTSVSPTSSSRRSRRTRRAVAKGRRRSIGEGRGRLGVGSCRSPAVQRCSESSRAFALRSVRPSPATRCSSP